MGCTGVSMLMELDLWWWWEEQLLSIPREGNSFRILSHIRRINIRLPFGSIPRGQKKKKKKKKIASGWRSKSISWLCMKFNFGVVLLAKQCSFACICVTAATKFDNNELIGSQRSWQNLIGLTGKGNACSQLIEFQAGKGNKKKPFSLSLSLSLFLSLSLIENQPSTFGNLTCF